MLVSPSVVPVLVSRHHPRVPGVEAQLFESDWDGELPLDRARQKGAGWVKTVCAYPCARACVCRGSNKEMRMRFAVFRVIVYFPSWVNPLAWAIWR